MNAALHTAVREAARLQIGFQILQPQHDKTLHGQYEAICNIAVAFDLLEEVVSNSLDIVKLCCLL